MFLKFYPDEENDAEEFSNSVALENYTPAELQHHFIYHRKNHSSEAKKIDSKIIRHTEDDDWKNIYSWIRFKIVQNVEHQTNA